MVKSELTDKVIRILEEYGFSVCDCRGVRSCFDVFAKKDKTLMVKVLINIEGLTEVASEELVIAALSLSSTPILIGECMKNAKLRDSVVYTRYGINAFTCATLKNILEEVAPLVHSVRGDYVVNVGSELLKNLRIEAGMTMQELASALKISKQSIYRYEQSGIIPLNVVSELVEFFEDFNDSRIEFKDDIFGGLISGHIKKSPDEQKTIKSEVLNKHLTDLMKKVIREFNHIGFSTTPVSAPFDIFVQEEERIFTVVSNDSRILRKKVKIVEKISEMTDTYTICVSEKKQKDFDIILIKPDELKGITSSRELIRLLLED